MKTFKKTNKNKGIYVSKKDSAEEAIGKIEKNTDKFILTYGQFSLIDALAAILKQTGKSDVIISTWTAAHSHLDRTAELIESLSLKSFRMIVDRSFKTRQQKYYDHMVDLFGIESIREITTHAKFMVISNDLFNVVVRTSMNLNENPRLENIEISENKEFADFFIELTDELFNEYSPGVSSCSVPKLDGIENTNKYKLVESGFIRQYELNEPKYTHEIAEKGEIIEI